MILSRLRELLPVHFLQEIFYAAGISLIFPTTHKMYPTVSHHNLIEIVEIETPYIKGLSEMAKL